MRNSGNVWPKYLTKVFAFHSSPCSVILNAFFISIRQWTNLPLSLWWFTSFLRIPSVFWNASLVFALSTANHPSAFCHRGHFPQKVCGGWGRRKGGKSLFCQSCGCSVLHSSVKSCSLIQAGISESFQRPIFWINSSGSFPSKEHLPNPSPVKGILLSVRRTWIFLRLWVQPKFGGTLRGETFVSAGLN